MKFKILTTSAVDLAAEDVPFLVNYTLVGFAVAGAVTIEQSDASGSGYEDLVALPALTSGACAYVTPTKRYIRVKSSGVAILLGN